MTAGVLGGAVAGGLVAVGAVHSLAQASDKPAISTPRTETEPPRDGKLVSPAGASDRAGMRVLDERLKRLEAAGEKAEPGSVAEPPPEPPTREEHQAQHAALIGEHRQQAADGEWAPMAARALSEDLAVAKAQGLSFDVAELDCRTTTCIMTAEWKTRDEALSQYEYLLHYPTRAACARQILVAEEANAAGKFAATMVYDCTDWRADGANLSRAVAAPPFQRAAAAAAQ